MIRLFIIFAVSIAFFSKQSFGNTNTIFSEKNGCFLLYNLTTNKYQAIVGEKHCSERYSPCSTFKVPLAVMAFDSEVLKNENQVLKWDGSKYWMEVWQQDHDAVTWLKNSVVWFSQRLTVGLGQKTIDRYLEKFKYGNKDFSGAITRAWLVAPDSKLPALKISAFEQAEFMKALWTNSLPVNERAMNITKQITFLETSPNGFKLSGKTGSNNYDSNIKKRLGWFVGHLEKNNQKYIVVTNFNDLVPTDDEMSAGPRAKEMTKEILKEKDLW
ncbi:class D beta-lactamase [Leptospira ilyithenensis]|uniref:beta-lactamase n=1 Tax=Leptospira ilyithenensis TaxID=2484901 RepID=A0A4R9LTV4_9LEPT|nr:class D beta-lactamase [Leptospira ilyithenensis]TGN13389.1 class D beta-lactamase [Leptospira ilyithenensis]